jgi:hypothetical protein
MDKSFKAKFEKKELKKLRDCPKTIKILPNFGEFFFLKLKIKA